MRDSLGYYKAGMDQRPELVSLNNHEYNAIIICSLPLPVMNRVRRGLNAIARRDATRMPTSQVLRLASLASCTWPNHATTIGLPPALRRSRYNAAPRLHKLFPIQDTSIQGYDVTHTKPSELAACKRLSLCGLILVHVAHSAVAYLATHLGPIPDVIFLVALDLHDGTDLARPD
jgi:hypothetical protein